MRKLLVMALAMMTLQMAAQSETKDEKKVITSENPESKPKDRNNEGTSSHPSREPVEGNTPKRNPNDTGTSRRAPKDDKREPKPCINPKMPERQY